MSAVFIRRFYLELVAFRHRYRPGAASALAALSTEGMRDALAGLARIVAASASPNLQIRIAAVVETRPGAEVATTIAVEAERAAATLAAAGPSFALDLWPQRPDDRTRFLNTGTAADHLRSLDPLLSAIAARRSRFACDLGLALDLEPSQSFLAAGWRLGALWRGEHEGGLLSPAADAAAIAAGLFDHLRYAGRGLAALTTMRDHIRAAGFRTHAAVMPFADGPARTPRLRHLLLGCPDLDAAGIPLWDRPAAMCYASALRHILGRPSRPLERRILRAWARRQLRFAQMHAVPPAIVLGLTSHGVLQTEPVYTDLAHLHEDVRLATDLGFHDIGVFSLEGILFGPSGLPDDGAFHPTRPDWHDWARAVIDPSAPIALTTG